MLVDIGHDVFEAIKLFDVPEISSRLISSIERTLFVMMMLFFCGGQFWTFLERVAGTARTRA